jgi:hypothetical protein
MIDNGLYVDKELTRHSSLTGFSVSNVTPSLVAPASAKRVRITFINAGTNIMQIAPNNPADGTRFMQLPGSGGIITFDKNDVGSMIQQPWFALALVATTGLSVIDTVEA